MLTPSPYVQKWMAHLPYLNHCISLLSLLYMIQSPECSADDNIVVVKYFYHYLIYQQRQHHKFPCWPWIRLNRTIVIPKRNKKRRRKAKIEIWETELRKMINFSRKNAHFHSLRFINYSRRLNERELAQKKYNNKWMKQQAKKHYMAFVFSKQK